MLLLGTAQHWWCWVGAGCIQLVTLACLGSQGGLGWLPHSSDEDHYFWYVSNLPPACWLRAGETLLQAKH